MHSSRMRTGRSLTVCRTLPPGRVVPGGVCFSGGMCFWGGVLPRGCFLGGLLSRRRCASGGVSQHALRQTPPVNRMTDRCKNITLATPSLQPITRMHSSRMHTTHSSPYGGVSLTQTPQRPS